MFEGTHNFCYHNVVVSETSSSTKIRLINNTSSVTPGIGTLVSVNTKYPSFSLNNIAKCIFNFMLYDNKLSCDISKCYRKILVDPLSAKLRLFCWLEMVKDKPNFIYFERSTLDFGDAPASQSVESAENKYVIPACQLKISKVILAETRYADNCLFSFQNKEKVMTVSKDIEQAHELYSWPLKQLVTNHSADPSVFERLQVNTEHVEILFGLRWHIQNNTFLPNLYLTLQGKNRGKSVGSPLAEDEFTIMSITREIFSRVSAQMYDILGIFLGPAIFSCKVIMSRICKLTSLSELTRPIYEIDQELAGIAYNFLIKLKDLDKITPFPASFIPNFNELIYIVVFSDGGLSGFGSVIYFVSKNQQTGDLTSRLCFASGALGRKTVPNHEIHSRVHGLASVKKILNYLNIHPFINNRKIKIYSIGDSLAVAQLFNPKLSIKKIYLRNCMILASQECISITESFPNIEIKLAFLPGTLNMADSLTKFCPDPIKVINSINYRQGPGILTEKDFESKITIFYEVKGKKIQIQPIFR